jgi:hypothetical protein
MPERELARRVETVILAAVMTIGIVGLALLPLTSAPYVSAMVRAADSARVTGLGHEMTLETAEHVRRFVTDRSAPPLPAAIAGRPAYDRAAVDHLVDVREVLVPARFLAVILGLAACAWVLVRRRSRSGRRVIAGALAGAGWTLVTVTGLVVLVGTLDFGTLFARFHDLFFAPGTWQFAEDALLIQVFPLSFWVASGAIWGLLVIAGATGALVLARRLRFTVGNNGV